MGHELYEAKSKIKPITLKPGELVKVPTHGIYYNEAGYEEHYLKTPLRMNEPGKIFGLFLGEHPRHKDPTKMDSHCMLRVLVGEQIWLFRAKKVIVDIGVQYVTWSLHKCDKNVN